MARPATIVGSDKRRKRNSVRPTHEHGLQVRSELYESGLRHTLTGISANWDPYGSIAICLAREPTGVRRDEIRNQGSRGWRWSAGGGGVQLDKRQAVRNLQQAQVPFRLTSINRLLSRQATRAS